MTVVWSVKSGPEVAWTGLSDNVSAAIERMVQNGVETEGIGHGSDRVVVTLMISDKSSCTIKNCSTGNVNHLKRRYPDSHIPSSLKSEVAICINIVVEHGVCVQQEHGVCGGKQ